MTAFGNTRVGIPKDPRDRLVKTTEFRKLCAEPLSVPVETFSQRSIVI